MARDDASAVRGEGSLPHCTNLRGQKYDRHTTGIGGIGGFLLMFLFCSPGEVLPALPALPVLSVLELLVAPMVAPL